MTLEFIRPIKAINAVEFTFKYDQKQTTINWTMTGSRSYLEKVFSIVLRLNSMIGKDFEKGLQNMKEIVESEKPPHEEPKK